MTMPARRVDASETQPYRMSFTSGGLYLNECVVVATSYLEIKDWDRTVSHLLESDVLSLPKAKSKRRILREIAVRLETLDEEELEFLVNAHRQEQALLLWISLCRGYRLIREVAVELVRERYLSYRLDLQASDFDIFVDRKAEWDDMLDSVSASTRERFRQTVFKTMREVGILNDDHRIQTTYVTPSLRRLIMAKCPADLLVFPGAVIEGGKS